MRGSQELICFIQGDICFPKSFPSFFHSFFGCALHLILNLLREALRSLLLRLFSGNRLGFTRRNEHNLVGGRRNVSFEKRKQAQQLCSIFSAYNALLAATLKDGLDGSSGPELILSVWIHSFTASVPAVAQRLYGIVAPCLCAYGQTGGALSRAHAFARLIVGWKQRFAQRALHFPVSFLALGLWPFFLSLCLSVFFFSCLASRAHCSF
jgi:hypothetical protein